jgi:hypothetical protein
MTRNNWIALATLAGVAAIGACSPRGGQAGERDRAVQGDSSYDSSYARTDTTTGNNYNNDRADANSNKPKDNTANRDRSEQPITYTVASGTHVDLTISDELSSRKNKAGDKFTAKVAQDVRDPAGNVVIEAGSTVNGVVVAVKPAPNRRTPGTLTIALQNVEVDGGTFPITATIDSVQTEHRTQGINSRDAAKVGIGAAAGAVVGQVISKNTKGTVIGAVVGGMAGAGVAAETKDLDIVIPDDSHILVTVTQPLRVALNADDVRDRTSKANNNRTSGNR